MKKILFQILAPAFICIVLLSCTPPEDEAFEEYLNSMTETADFVPPTLPSELNEQTVSEYLVIFAEELEASEHSLSGRVPELSFLWPVYAKTIIEISGGYREFSALVSPLIRSSSLYVLESTYLAYQCTYGWKRFFDDYVYALERRRETELVEDVVVDFYAEGIRSGEFIGLDHGVYDMLLRYRPEFTFAVLSRHVRNARNKGGAVRLLRRYYPYRCVDVLGEYGPTLLEERSLDKETLIPAASAGYLPALLRLAEIGLEDDPDFQRLHDELRLLVEFPAIAGYGEACLVWLLRQNPDDIFYDHVRDRYRFIGEAQG